MTLLTFKIASGGQTGAERAALNWAIRSSIVHGGYCPKGRLEEDGKIPQFYRLQETVSTHYSEGTEKNVVMSDGTAVFTISNKLDRRSRLAWRLAKQHHQAVLHLHSTSINPGRQLATFIQHHKINCLNVAGSRASKEPEIGDFVSRVLDEAFQELATTISSSPVTASMLIGEATCNNPTHILQLIEGEKPLWTIQSMVPRFMVNSAQNPWAWFSSSETLLHEALLMIALLLRPDLWKGPLAGLRAKVLGHYPADLRSLPMDEKVSAYHHVKKALTETGVVLTIRESSALENQWPILHKYRLWYEVYFVRATHYYLGGLELLGKETKR